MRSPLKIFSVFILSLLWCGHQGYAQKTIFVDWAKPENRWINNENLTVFRFHNATYDENGFPYLQVLQEGIWKTAEIQVLTSSAISEEERRLISPTLMAAIERVELKGETLFQSRSAFTLFKYCPLIERNGVVQKVLSFVIITREPSAQLATSQKSNQAKNNFRTAAAPASVLASGTWYRIETKERGLYKLTYQNLKQLGLNPDNIDPRRISLFGNHGGVLPQANSTPRYDDLLENAIFVFGENDGRFNTEDYILFYASGPDTIAWNSATNRYTHSHHPYTNSTSFYLSPDAGSGKRIPFRPDRKSVV